MLSLTNEVSFHGISGMRSFPLFLIFVLWGCSSPVEEDIQESNESDSSLETPIDYKSINPDEIFVEKINVDEVVADLESLSFLKEDEYETSEDGLVYKIGDSVPYSGGIKTFFDGGGVFERMLLHRGQKHGPYEKYYENGKLSRRSGYKEGKLHGSHEKWYPGGQKAVKGQYLEGVEVGEFTWWHDNGFRSERGSYKNGKEHGAWFYYSEIGRVYQKLVFYEGVDLEVEDGY